MFSEDFLKPAFHISCNCRALSQVSFVPWACKQLAAVSKRQTRSSKGDLCPSPPDCRKTATTLSFLCPLKHNRHYVFLAGHMLSSRQNSSISRRHCCNCRELLPAYRDNTFLHIIVCLWKHYVNLLLHNILLAVISLRGVYTNKLLYVLSPCKHTKNLLFFMFPFGRKHYSDDSYNTFPTVATIWKPG